MPTYISLVNWTEQGIRDVRQTVERANAATALATRMGGQLKEVYWTIGQFDLVTVADFPDDETGMAYLLALGSQGNIRTTTLRAYDGDQVKGILGKLG
jgi:uncharacterized protein with GYD domain